MRQSLIAKVSFLAGVFALVATVSTMDVHAANSKSGSEPTTGEGGGKIRYRKGKDVNFDEMLINGQLQRPEIAVVTGEVGQGTDGLLRLRENFIDQVAIDFGEVAQ